MKKFFITSLFLLTACSSNTEDLLKKDSEKYQLALQVGAYEKARDLAIQSLKLDPDNSETRFSLADIYIRMNKYDMARQELEIIYDRTGKNDKNYTRVIVALMKSSLMLHQYERALSLYQNYLLAKKSSLYATDTLHGKANMYAAIAYCKLNKYDICIEELKHARKYLPGDTALADNIKIAQYMANAHKGNPDPYLLYSGYVNTESREMYANLVMALLRDGQEKRAFELLNLQYSREDTMEIVNDLKRIKRKHDK